MPIAIDLEEEEALVLFELLASRRLEDLVDVPERYALWALEGYLEKKLVAPFRSDYSNLLEAARQSLVERYGDIE